jgi:YVTN family beta-propeller protein
MSIKIDRSGFCAGGRPRSAVREDAMKLRISGLLAAFALASLLGSAQSLAQNAYITNRDSNSVSVIDTATNKVTATIPVGGAPIGVAVTSDGSRVYVANANSNSVSVIDGATNTVTATIPVNATPPVIGVAVTPDGSKVYVTNYLGNTVSVIDAATNTVTATILVSNPWGVAVGPDGGKVYVTTLAISNSVSVIATVTNTVTATIPVGRDPRCLRHLHPAATKICWDAWI